MRSELLAWYDRHGRSLPWRESDDPYAIWVSEVMCQQTRVDTAIPYYHRFLERFPTPQALAAASEDEVLAAWSGLGYYRRARMLHAGVKELVERYGGELPEDPEARRGLPGVGRYTAGALGSIAFDLPEPIVDGNVARVLSRVFRIETTLGKAVTERALWSRAEELVQGPRPGDFNQALMELGALICTPKAPSCDACPWANGCAAREAGIQESLPVPRKKKKPKAVSFTAVVATRGRGAAREVFLTKPSSGELFAGLWLVPMVESPPVQLELGAAKSPSARTEALRCLKAHGLRATLGDRCGTVTHVLSHRRYTVQVFRATGAKGADASAHRVDRLDGLGVARLTDKIVDAALGP
jgi:A/G-specific adenine glycosylase